MAEIIKTYKQNIPAMRFIGKKYGNNDRVNGGFGEKWHEWFSNSWFDVIEKQTNKKIKDIYEDGDAYIGLMRWKDGEPFEYWIGIFMPENTPAPEGYSYIDFPESTIGVCWVLGKEPEIYGIEDKCAAKLKENGFKVIPDEKGAYWFFERYGCPRFTTPDEQGKVILDICHYIEKN